MNAIEQSAYCYPVSGPRNKHFEMQLQRREAFLRGARWQATEDVNIVRTYESYWDVTPTQIREELESYVEGDKHVL